MSDTQKEYIIYLISFIFLVSSWTVSTAKHWITALFYSDLTALAYLLSITAFLAYAFIFSNVIRPLVKKVIK